MTEHPADPVPAPPPAPAPSARSQLDRRLVVVLTVVVIWLGVVRVLEDTGSKTGAATPAEAPAEASPDSAHPALATALQTEAIEGVTLRYDEDLSRFDRLRWSAVAEVAADGTEQPYRGKLTLHFGEGVREAFPVVDGAVEVIPRPAHLRALLASGTLGVEFKRHDRVDHDVSWLVAAGAPEIVEQDVTASATRLTVRNPSIGPKRVRVRAGWKDGGAWVQGPGDVLSSALIEVDMAPGETRELTLAYAPSSVGSLAEPMARTILSRPAATTTAAPTGAAEVELPAPTPPAAAEPPAEVSPAGGG